MSPAVPPSLSTTASAFTVPSLEVKYAGTCRSIDAYDEIPTAIASTTAWVRYRWTRKCLPLNVATVSEPAGGPDPSERGPPYQTPGKVVNPLACHFRACERKFVTSLLSQLHRGRKALFGPQTNDSSQGQNGPSPLRDQAGTQPHSPYNARGAHKLASPGARRMPARTWAYGPPRT